MQCWAFPILAQHCCVIVTFAKYFFYRAAWLYLEVRSTRYKLTNCFDTYLLSRIDIDTFKLPAERYIYLDKKNLHFFQSIANHIKFEYALRVANMAKSDLRDYRMAATYSLSQLKFMENFDYHYLSQTFDAQTAIGLARIPSTDSRFFVLPPNRQSPNYITLMSSLRDMLTGLNDLSAHPCLTYCVERVFQVSRFTPFPPYNSP